MKFAWSVNDGLLFRLKLYATPFVIPFVLLKKPFALLALFLIAAPVAWLCLVRCLFLRCNVSGVLFLELVDGF